jgi:hypothetical protein
MTNMLPAYLFRAKLRPGAEPDAAAIAAFENLREDLSAEEVDDHTWKFEVNGKNAIAVDLRIRRDKTILNTWCICYLWPSRHENLEAVSEETENSEDGEELKTLLPVILRRSVKGYNAPARLRAEGKLLQIFKPAISTPLEPEDYIDSVEEELKNRRR